MEPQTKKEKRCPSCGYVWVSRVATPKKCPSCIKWLVEHPKAKT